MWNYYFVAWWWWFFFLFFYFILFYRWIVIKGTDVETRKGKWLYSETKIQNIMLIYPSIFPNFSHGWLGFSSLRLILIWIFLWQSWGPRLLLFFLFVCGNLHVKILELTFQCFKIQELKRSLGNCENSFKQNEFMKQN